MKADYELTTIDRSNLYATLVTEGWQVYKRIVESVIEGFRVDIVNATKDEEIIAKQKLAKAASQAWVKIADLLNKEVELFKLGKVQEGVIDDPTEETLQIDNIQDAVKDLPNFL